MSYLTRGGRWTGGSTTRPCSIRPSAMASRHVADPPRAGPQRSLADAGSPAAKEDRHAHGSIQQPDPSARHETAIPQVVRCGRRRGGKWRVLVDRSDRPSYAGRRTGRHADQAHRRVDAGEPLVRPLLRLRALDRRLRPARRLHPARRLGRHRRAVPLRRASRRPTSRTTGTPSTTSGTAARWTASTECRHLGDGLLPGARLPFYYWLHDELDAARSTSSARCSGRPGRIASTSWPGRRAGSRRTACGATASSTTR